MICTTTRRAGAVSSLFSPRRRVSTEAISALDKWTASIVKQPLEVADHFNPHHLANLYATLPTTVSQPECNRLHPGHHLVFFNASNPEAALRQDGSDPNFGPPPPFSRRIWAGGSMRWSAEYARNTAIGTLGTARSQVVDVKKVGLNGSNPMVFVKQKIDIHHRHGLDAVSYLVEDERTHVYIPISSGVKRSVKSVDGLPDKIDFSYQFTTTPTTLFRFSALTFNGHYIHLDAEHARSEGYDERLVHAPLSALMMLETLRVCHPKAALLLKGFTYRAINPMILNKQLTIHGSWNDRQDSCVLWMVNEDGQVGMTASVELYEPCPGIGTALR